MYVWAAGITCPPFRLQRRVGMELGREEEVSERSHRFCVLLPLRAR